MDRNRRKKEFYEIRIKGHQTPSWSETFDGMQLNLMRRGETLITGEVADQIGWILIGFPPASSGN